MSLNNGNENENEEKNRVENECLDVDDADELDVNDAFKSGV